MPRVTAFSGHASSAQQEKISLAKSINFIVTNRAKYTESHTENKS